MRYFLFILPYGRVPRTLETGLRVTNPNTSFAADEQCTNSDEIRYPCSHDGTSGPKIDWVGGDASPPVYAVLRLRGTQRFYKYGAGIYKLEPAVCTP